TKGGDPPVYFHRVLQRERVLTPWKKIDLDIDKNVIAFFRDKQLYLAWTTFVEKGNDQQDSTFPESTDTKMPPALRRTEIRLAIREYTGSKWLPRRVSQDALITKDDTASLNQERVFLSVSPDPARFTVDVYLGNGAMHRLGSFLLTGCKGYPELVP